jgi:hypothetical protein
MPEHFERRGATQFESKTLRFSHDGKLIRVAAHCFLFRAVTPAISVSGLSGPILGAFSYKPPQKQSRFGEAAPAASWLLHALHGIDRKYCQWRPAGERDKIAAPLAVVLCLISTLYCPAVAAAFALFLSSPVS